MEVREGYKKTEVGIIPSDWDVFELNAVANVIDSLHQTPKFSKNGYAMVRVTDIKSGNLKLENTFKVSEAIYYEFIKNYKPKKGDIVLSRVGSYGVASYVETDEPFCMGQNTVVIDPKITNKYLYYILNSSETRKQVENGSFGSGYKSLSLKNIKELKLPLSPTKAEQTTIATVLSDADALISSLERLIAKKRKIKQGAMQELLTGKKRLPGFGGQWQIKIFPEVCWFQEGPGVRNTQFTASGVKLLNGTNINSGKLNLETTDRYISEHEACGIYSHFLAEEGDIIIACSGITVEKFHEKVTIIKKEHLPLCMNTSTMRFKVTSKKLVKSFLFYFLQSEPFKKQIGGQATGSAQLNFGPSHVDKVEIDLPKPDEQTAIAQILSDMDTEIEALEQKLTKYRMIKQWMIQELLTGKTRLV